MANSNESENRMGAGNGAADRLDELNATDNTPATYTVSADEAAFLSRILNRYLGDLRLATPDSENSSTGEGWSHEGQMLRDLLQRFSGEVFSDEQQEMKIVEVRELMEESH